MKHRIVSFNEEQNPREFVTYQKRVFDFFNVPLEQVTYNDHRDGGHSGAVQAYLAKHTDWDYFTLFDLDCIPTSHNCIPKALELISDGNTLYGNAQASNVFPDINPYPSPPFIAPSFFNMSREVWNKTPYKTFSFTRYPNPDGHVVEADIAEAFSRECEKVGVKLIYAYPTHCYTDHTWKYGGHFGYPKFEYGNATEFESETYHNFQIRIQDKSELFIPYCKKILNEA
jgi:hypothetical protein